MPAEPRLGRASSVDGRIFGYACVAVTVGMAVYGQIVFRWRIGVAGDPPEAFGDLVSYGLRVLLEPWMLTVAASVVVATVAWWAALREFELSFAYPFMALSFPLVLMFSALFFGESITPPKVIGLVLVAAGLIVASQG